MLYVQHKFIFDAIGQREDYYWFHFKGLALQRLDPFEALAEIFDFVAGLVQRVPKKPNFVKADLQNSTAILPRKRKFEGEKQISKKLGYLFTFVILLFCLKQLKYRSDPSTTKANAFSAQDDQLGEMMLDRC